MSKDKRTEDRTRGKHAKAEEKPKKVTDIFEKTLRRSHIVTYSNDTSSSRKSTQYLCGIIIEQSETLCKFKIE